jgi:hypothetical protein
VADIAVPAVIDLVSLAWCHRRGAQRRGNVVVPDAFGIVSLRSQ